MSSFFSPGARCVPVLALVQHAQRVPVWQVVEGEGGEAPVVPLLPTYGIVLEYT